MSESLPRHFSVFLCALQIASAFVLVCAPLYPVFLLKISVTSQVFPRATAGANGGQGAQRAGGEH